MAIDLFGYSISNQGLEADLSSVFQSINSRKKTYYMACANPHSLTVAADLQWSKWRDSGLDKNSVVADPLLSISVAGRFQLSSASPALKMGFKPIPFDKIGPHKDPLRASWPMPLQDIKAHQIPVN